MCCCCWTNGYVQTNKLFVRPRNVGKCFDDGQGTAGLSKKPNKDILENDCKRQNHLKLAVLEDELSDAEIAQRLEEARLNFEASAAEESDAKISDTQTHHKEREADGSFPSSSRLKRVSLMMSQPTGERVVKVVE
uniref:CWF21 domain-containing protein n=1 Tax=Brassica oleracea var. oleracea TaxID=109376 RepID=A0A0D3BG08_BRAOL